ncbi:MAG: AAA family ATPase [Deltaproteobacteria bacterium]|nr:AAA family ATPase [Deltaproteobacteria bacterium]
MGFIDRPYEEGLLKERWGKSAASLIVVYGRRRVGKTRLIEEFYKDKKIWKFDGLEREPKSKQIRQFLATLSEYTRNPLFATAECRDWLDAFKLLDKAVQDSSGGYRMAIFLDELPYMANRRAEMISDLKWAWDNLWSKRNGFTLILCGSVASFMVDNVIHSSALYGRVDLEIHLKPLLLKDAREFFADRYSPIELVQLYMFCGGIPAYWLQIDQASSVASNINRLCFLRDGYFTGEFGRIFKDVFHEERTYRKIIMLFSKFRSLKTAELLDLLQMSGGSGFQRYLDNLEKAGFIKNYVPCGYPIESTLRRYRLEDEYLHFYFKFIRSNSKKIGDNVGENIFAGIMQTRSYQSWAGLAFERLCLKHIRPILKSLNIDQLVKDYGPYYDRGTNTKDGVQIDLMFERHDPVVTVCEIKYYSGKVGKWIIDDMEKKISILEPTKKGVEKILITTEGATEDLNASGYFSRVLLTDSLFC